VTERNRGLLLVQQGFKQGSHARREGGTRRKGKSYKRCAPSKKRVHKKTSLSQWETRKKRSGVKGKGNKFKRWRKMEERPFWPRKKCTGIP